MQVRKINFIHINNQIRPNIICCLRRWLPDGEIKGHEYIALNPKRNDRKKGSFKINIHTGKWADFADHNAQGGDIISLAAYLFNQKQHNAALELAQMIGVNPYV